MRKTVLIILCLIATVGIAAPVRSILGGRTLTVSPNEPPPSYTCEDYIQDGLLCMWDGIENAGLGLHDNNALTWVDLTGNGFDLTVDPTCGEWEANCIVPYSNCGCPAYKRNAQTEFSTLKRYPVRIEVVTRGPMTAGSGTFRMIVSLTYCNSAYQQIGSVYNYIGKRGRGYPVSVTQQPQSFSMSYSLGYANGIYCGESYINMGVGSWGRNYNDIGIAGVVPSDNSTDRTRGYQYPYRIFTIRVYDRELTEEEIIWNWMIDRARFGL